jgi:CysZ protein
MIRSLVYGITLPLHAAKLVLRQPILLFWSLLPVALTLALYGFVILKAQNAAQAALSARFAAWGWNDSGWGVWGLNALAQLILIIAGAFTFSAVASIISSPFNDFLAEKTEKFAEPRLPPVPDMPLSAKFRLILIDLGKSVTAAVAMVFAILLSWIPIVNVVAFGIAFMLVAFQYISYPQTRRGEGLWKGLFFLVRHPFACIGFGGAMTFLFAIPLLSSLCFPLAVVGGTLLVARAQKTPGLKALR